MRKDKEPRRTFVGIHKMPINVWHEFTLQAKRERLEHAELFEKMWQLYQKRGRRS